MEQRRKPDTETELKLALTEAGLRVIAHHPAFQAQPHAAQPGQRHETTVYFDTATHDLASAGMGLRIRHSRGKRVQTLKTEGAAGVATQRGEWEWEVTGDSPDLTRLADTPAAPWVKTHLAGSLHKVFTTEIDRTTRILHLDGAVAEAALDRGHIVAGTASEAVQELELELQKGTAGPLYRLALELHQAEPLRIETASKAARGLRLAFGTTPDAATPAAPVPSRADSAAQAFRTILLGHLGQMLANQEATSAGDAEGLHQMRIAVRRLFSALALFAPFLDRVTTHRFTDELRQTSKVMGEARDWDVFCTEMLSGAEASQPGTRAVWEELLRAPAEARRRDAHATLVRALTAPPFTALVLGLAAWAEDGALDPALLGDRALANPVTSLAPRLLDRVAHKVMRRGQHLSASTDVERHAFRKSLKKLRYATEDLAALFPEDEATHYVAHCKSVLKLLGQANDAVTGTTLAQSLSRAPAPAIGHLDQYLRARREKALNRLAKQWRMLQEEAPFWR